MNCPLCNGTAYAAVPGGVAPCACEAGRKIGKRPAKRKKKPAGPPKAHWKEWDKNLERMKLK